MLAGVAASVSVLFPWGSLLRAMAGGDSQALRNLAALCAPGATVELVTAIDAEADAGELKRLGISRFSPERMASAWRDAGFRGVDLATLPPDHAYQTTWWRKIRQRESRTAVRLGATAP